MGVIKRTGRPAGWKDYPLKPGLPPRPIQVAQLPVAKNGYPVPWFVDWINGEPEFRAMDPDKMRLAVRERRCWVCGHGMALGPVSFLVGPMCTVNKISAEPPMHKECAVFSVTACPFLTKPGMTRRENGLPANMKDAPGVAIKRNPGVTALWITGGYKPFVVDGGILFDIGRAAVVSWYREGRAATREEVREAFATGCGTLRGLAAADGAEAVAEIETALKAAERYWPKEPAPSNV